MRQQSLALHANRMSYYTLVALICWPCQRVDGGRNGAGLRDAHRRQQHHGPGELPAQDRRPRRAPDPMGRTVRVL